MFLCLGEKVCGSGQGLDIFSKPVQQQKSQSFIGVKKEDNDKSLYELVINAELTCLAITTVLSISLIFKRCAWILQECQCRHYHSIAHAGLPM